MFCRYLFILALSTFVYACNNSEADGSKDSSLQEKTISLVKNDSAYYQYLTEKSNQYYKTHFQNHRTYTKDRLEKWQKEALSGNLESYTELHLAFYYMSKDKEIVGVSMIMAEKYNSSYACLNVYNILVEEMDANNVPFFKKLALYYLYKGYEIEQTNQPDIESLKIFKHLLFNIFGDDFAKYNSKMFLIDSNLVKSKLQVY